MKLCYKETATFVKVTPNAYGDTKTASEQAEVEVIFVQATGYSRSNHQEAVDADARCYPNPENEFIVSNHNRLEGMYILNPLFGAENDEAWFKVVSVSVNRNHLLGVEIDNIELVLKKTGKVSGVS